MLSIDRTLNLRGSNNKSKRIPIYPVISSTNNMRPLLASLAAMLLLSKTRNKQKSKPPDDPDDSLTARSNPASPTTTTTTTTPTPSSSRVPTKRRGRSLLALTLAITILTVTRRLRSSSHKSRAKKHPPVNLRAHPYKITIVTTSSLPWFTGTSVNPLLRAVYLARDGHDVIFVVPWIEDRDVQRRLFPGGRIFEEREEQARWIGDWVWSLGVFGKRECGEKGCSRLKQQHEGLVIAKGGEGRGSIAVRFYEGVYVEEFGSILPLESVTKLFEGDNGKRMKEVCVLEEPEHLTWHHSGESWPNIFGMVIGVVHTNYLEYARKHGFFGPQRAFLLRFLNMWVCKSYCHRVIKLSDAVQFLPRSVTCNVHGVRSHFIDIGRRLQQEQGRIEEGDQENGLSSSLSVFTKGAYFLGKVLWAKGYRPLVKLMEQHYTRNGEQDTLPIDFFGTGPDLSQVRQRVKTSPALSKVRVHGVYIDHASPFLHPYKVCVNPSSSDVVCTVTAEALAMGKFVICLKHPSNAFFMTFPNCLTYLTPREFSEQVLYALHHEPKSLSQHDMYRLSWEAATHRFYDAVGEIKDGGTGRVSHLDYAMAATHKTLSGLVTPPSMKCMRRKSRENC